VGEDQPLHDLQAAVAQLQRTVDGLRADVAHATEDTARCLPWLTLFVLLLMLLAGWWLLGSGR
jgi:hypothetical protein